MIITIDMDKFLQALKIEGTDEYREAFISVGEFQKALKIAEVKQSGWISVEERLPSKDEYLTHHNDGLDTLKRITIAYMTDTVEYTIGCYDGYKWMNQLGNKKIENVVAWKPFELYEPPKKAEGEGR